MFHTFDHCERCIFIRYIYKSTIVQGDGACKAQVRSHKTSININHWLLIALPQVTDININRNHLWNLVYRTECMTGVYVLTISKLTIHNNFGLMQRTHR